MLLADMRIAPHPTIQPDLIARQLHITLGMIDASGDDTLTDCADHTRAAYRAALRTLAGALADALYELTVDHGIGWDVAVDAIRRETAHDRAPATMPAGTAGDPRVTRKPTHGPDYDDLRTEDFLLFIDGRRVGGTYRCADGTWTSWGCCGASPGHPTREAAEQAQVDGYPGGPGLCPECDGETAMVHTAHGYTVCPGCHHLIDLRGRAVWPRPSKGNR